MPTEPWQKVGTDLFHVNGKDFLLLMDYHSNYPEVAQLKSIKSIFGRHGIPQIVQSDNGPQYSNQEFQMFAEEYGFQHTTSSPLYPKANGKAEKGVEIVKRLLKKAAETKSDPYFALLTPIGLLWDVEHHPQSSSLTENCATHYHTCQEKEKQSRHQHQRQGHLSAVSLAELEDQE